MGGTAGRTLKTDGIDDIVDHYAFFKTNEVSCISTMPCPVGALGSAFGAGQALNLN